MSQNVFIHIATPELTRANIIQFRPFLSSKAVLMMTAMIVNMYFRALYPCTESFSSHNLRMHCIKTDIYMRERIGECKRLSCV